MLEDALHDLGPDVETLVVGVHDQIPDRGSVDVVGEDTPEANQTVAVPCGQNKVRVRQHLLRIFCGTSRCPGRVAVEFEELREVNILAFRESDHRLECDEGFVLH